MRLTRFPLYVFCFALCAGVMAISRPAAAQTSGVIRGCVQQSSGQLRIIGPGDDCRRTEQLLVWNVQGPPGPAGADGQDGKDGKDGMTNIVTAEQTANVSATRNPNTDIVWVPIPGAQATIVLNDAGTLDIHALGGVYGSGGGDAYCGFRVVVDGVPQGTPGLYGDRLVGVGSVTQGTSPYWTDWNLLRTLAVSSGAHTVSVEMTSLDQTCNTDARSFGSARLWVLGR